MQKIYAGVALVSMIRCKAPTQAGAARSRGFGCYAGVPTKVQ
jgi:hypothetical protein